jgi:CHRD domain
MKGRLKWAVGVAVLAAVAAAGTVAVAGGGGEVREDLTGYEENPSVSTEGNGTFRARIDTRDQEISYRLTYADLEADVTQAHIHFSQRAVNGPISVFLCSNLTDPAPPPGTQACPASPATVEGTIEPEDVIGPAAQGIEPGAFDELVDAIRAGATYVNVHSTKWPGGEIRAQLERGRHFGFDKDR